jgi:Family of unknown function (DUF6221)
MDDLIAFLRARLDERERVALAAAEGTPGHWRSGDRGHGSGIVLFGDGPDDWPDRSGDGVVVYDEGAPTQEQADHIADNDPDFVLADVAAKRKILDWLDTVEQFMERDDMSWHNLAGSVDVDEARKLLGLPYATHVRPGGHSRVPKLATSSDAPPSVIAVTILDPSIVIPLGASITPTPRCRRGAPASAARRLHGSHTKGFADRYRPLGQSVSLCPEPCCTERRAGRVRPIYPIGSHDLSGAFRQVRTVQAGRRFDTALALDRRAHPAADS